jgi:hypothetical protein
MDSEIFGGGWKIMKGRGECHAKWEVAGSWFAAQFGFARGAFETEFLRFAIRTTKRVLCVEL